MGRAKALRPHIEPLEGHVTPATISPSPACAVGACLNARKGIRARTI
jgi:hypothetical protein